MKISFWNRKSRTRALFSNPVPNDKAHRGLPLGIMGAIKGSPKIITVMWYREVWGLLYSAPIRRRGITSQTGTLKKQYFFSHWMGYDLGNRFPFNLNQMEFHLVQNLKENCHHDHIPFNVKGKGNIVFSVKRPESIDTNSNTKIGISWNVLNTSNFIVLFCTRYFHSSTLIQA